MNRPLRVFAAAHTHSRAPAEHSRALAELIDTLPHGDGSFFFLLLFFTGPGVRSGTPLHRKMGILTSSAAMAVNTAAWPDPKNLPKNNAVQYAYAAVILTENLVVLCSSPPHGGRHGVRNMVLHDP